MIEYYTASLCCRGGDARVC